MVPLTVHDAAALDMIITVHPTDICANGFGGRVKSVVKLDFCNRGEKESLILVKTSLRSTWSFEWLYGGRYNLSERGQKKTKEEVYRKLVIIIHFKAGLIFCDVK